ncbi:MAG: DUF167 domain-containing protein [Hyphomicrobiaceae bacterium]|nr:DUF167 domain-containing protein [Hyphomicrobiaceae bacterium]
MDPQRPWRVTPDGVVLRVRLTPKSSKDSVDGLEDTAEGAALKARVRALPADGAANEAVTRLVADWLGVAKGTVSLVTGGKSRIKSLAVRGDAAALTRRMEDLLGL